MIKKVKTEDLKVGMYVMLGLSWLRHSFMKPNFRITSEKQIKKILHDGIKEVKVDTSKSEVIEERDLYRDVLGSRGEAVGQLRTEVPPPASQVEAEVPPPASQVGTEAPPPVGQVETKAAPPVGQVETKAAPPGSQVKAKAAPPGSQVEAKAAPPGSQVETEAPRPGREFGPEIRPPEAREFNPIDQISEELRETIQNTGIPPQTKAKEVYNHSLKMMTNVLEDPKAGNIQSSKKMVYDIVDHILADDDTAECMAMITSHDYYTYTHSVNVGMLSVLLSKSLFKGSYDHDMREMGAGFFLHDLGKCDIPYDLINKPGRLSDDEWQMMRNHPQSGNKILVDTDQLTVECGLIIMQHHEREDGSGYPFRLSKDEIHPYARICSIADVYDALTSTRAYKQKVPPFEALRIMKDEMIQFFNRDIFSEFVLIFKG